MNEKIKQKVDKTIEMLKTSKKEIAIVVVTGLAFGKCLRVARLRGVKQGANLAIATAQKVVGDSINLDKEASIWVINNYDEFVKLGKTIL